MEAPGATYKSLRYSLTHEATHGSPERDGFGLASRSEHKVSTSFFNQVCGFTPQTDTRFTGLQAATAASTGRIIRQSSRTDDVSLTSADTFTLNLIDKAKEAAITATPKIRPVKISGKGGGGRRDYMATLTDKFVCYLHPYQITDLRTSTSTGQWLDITKAAMQGGEITGNALYTGSLGEYNGVILRSSFDVTNGVSNAGATVSTVNRAVLLGGQAAVMAFGQKDSPGKYRWNEELAISSVAAKAANENRVNSGKLLAA